MNGLESGVAQRAEREAHARRLAYLLETGWQLTEEGWIKDTSSSRWSKTSREIVQYDEGLSFEDGVKCTWRAQKNLEAAELAAKQRRGVRNGEN
jgi:hypothetical protein